MDKLLYSFILFYFLSNCGGIYKDESICNRNKAFALFTLSTSLENETEELDEAILLSLLQSEIGCTNTQKTRSSFSE
jgi:hypothetical protein